MTNLSDKRGYIMFDTDDDSVCSSLDGKESIDEDRHFVPSRQILRWNDWEKIHRYCKFSNTINSEYQVNRSCPISNRSYFKMRCKNTLMMASDILSNSKQVRWADDLVDVHTYSTPRIRGWELLRKKVLKTIDAIKHDIDF